MILEGRSHKFFARKYLFDLYWSAYKQLLCGLLFYLDILILNSCLIFCNNLVQKSSPSSSKNFETEPFIETMYLSRSIFSTQYVLLWQSFSVTVIDSWYWNLRKVGRQLRSHEPMHFINHLIYFLNSDFHRCRLPPFTTVIIYISLSFFKPSAPFSDSYCSYNCCHKHDTSDDSLYYTLQWE